MLKQKLLSVVSAVFVTACSQTDRYSCQGKTRNWPLRTDLSRGIEPLRVDIYVTREGFIRWNGKVVSPDNLRQYARINDALLPNPPIVLSHDPFASCENVEFVRDILDRLPMCHEGKCGEQATWERIYGRPVEPPLD